jgi:hypothetical protein
MLMLPSMWSLLISTLVFFVAFAYLRRYLEEQGIPKGTTRATLIFTFAFLLAWGAEKAAEWTQEIIEGPAPVVQTAPDPSPIPKEGDPATP